MPEIDFHGVRGCYTSWGQGDPTLFLHSGASSGRQWQKVVEHLASPRLSIAPDFLGFGDSDPWPESGKLTHDLQAALALRVLDAHAEGAADVVGHSYGGAAAVRLAVNHPGRVRSLVLIEPVVHHVLEESGDPLFSESIRVAQAFIASVELGEIEAGWEVFVDSSNGPGTWARLSPERRKRFLDQTAQTKEAFISNLVNRTSLAEYRAIQAPVTLIHGTRTSNTNLRIAALLRDAIPAATGIAIDGAGHMSPLTHPAEVAKLISAHLDRVSE